MGYETTRALLPVFGKLTSESYVKNLFLGKLTPGSNVPFGINDCEGLQMAVYEALSKMDAEVRQTEYKELKSLSEKHAETNVMNRYNIKRTEAGKK